MLEIFDRNPTSRVFHVDKECYVLYLGAHWDDYKPFLRLGTSRHLPENLPPIVSSIVVPDVITGNPLDEPASLTGDATGETHYVGDVRTVNKLKKFLDLESIPVEGLKKASRETDDNQNVYVYSYRDGNLKIKYHKNEVFDLHRREKQDAHFVARAQSVKNEYGRSPFKLPGEVYQRDGLVVRSGRAYLVSNGEIAALGLGEEYFPEIAAAGIDPDRISVVNHDDVDEAMLRYFKRCRAKGRTPRLSTPSGTKAKELAGIFRANSLPALKISVLEGEGNRFSFHKYSVSRSGEVFKASLPELEGPLVIGPGGSEPGAAIAVDTRSMTLAMGRDRRPLLDGCVYQFTGQSLTRTLIAERYLPERNYPYRDMLDSDESSLLDQFSYFFSELFAGRDPGKVLKTIRSNPLQRNLGRDGLLNPVTSVMIANTVEYLRFLKAFSPEIGRKTDGLASLLSRHEVNAASVPAHLPVVAEITDYDGVPYLFYRLAARITGDRVAHAESIVEKINAVPLVDYEAERKRLEELVSGLANPEQMEEARLRRIAERKKEQAAPTAEAKQTESEAKDAEASSTGAAATAGARAGTAGAGRSQRGGRRRRGGGPWRWLLPVLIVLLLLIALGALLMTGTIENRWFGDDGATTEQDGVGEAGDGEAGAGDATDEDTAAEGQAADGASAADGTAADEVAGQAAADAAAADAAAADAAAEDAEADEDAAESVEDQLPEGWPPESLPAIRALEQTPGVIITDEQVIGPGGIEITVMDIINLVNRIATDNGYAPMHTIDPERPDPDWIFPENVFVLPNGTRYTVVGGDTLWDITVRYMVARLGQDYQAFVTLTEEYEDLGTSDGRRGEIASELESIGRESHSENFTRLVVEKLEEWRD